jgi:hypothetical protein
MFKAFIIGSQIVQIRRQMETSQRIDALHAHHLNQAQAQARLNWIREQVFIVRQNFEVAAASLKSNPTRAFFICECNFGYLQREAISSQSFDDLRDKEYFHILWQYAASVRDNAQSLLSQETIEEVRRAALMQAILPQMRSLLAWTEIAELLPGGILKRHYSQWQIPFRKWSMVISSLIIFPLLILPLYLWATDPYPKILPRIRQLAQSVGGWVANHVARKDAMSIAAQLRAILEEWGLSLPSDFKGLKKAVTDAEEILSDFTNRYGFRPETASKSASRNLLKVSGR